jgi:NADPH2:quinone reductase
MRAAYYSEFGAAADVLRVGDIDRPEPGTGEVRVRISISAVNPTDWKARRGSRAMQFPYVVPHQDGAGVIDAVGPGVSGERIGERVWVYFAAAGRPHGTAAEWSVVPARQAVALPDDVSFELGACMGVPALTAHRCLYWDGPIDGLDVLVAGGAGAVGHYAIQLAKAGGARRVTATVSTPEKAEMARDAGADHVVDYRAADAADRIRMHHPDGVHRIAEVALGTNIDLDIAVLGEHGSVVSYATTPTEPTLNVRDLMFGNQTLRFMMLYDVGEAALAQGVAEVDRCLRSGALTPLPLHRFGLDAVVAAHEACENKAVGKVIIDL